MWGRSNGAGYKPPSIVPPLRQEPIPRTDFERQWARKKSLLRRERPDMRISNETITNCLEKEHVAFMQGSNMIYLPTILAEGGLLCSDYLRSRSRATFTKDAGNGTGDVCYFRFIKDTRPEGQLKANIIRQNINHFFSVGASGGIFYVLKASEVRGLTYRTAASTDSQGKGRSSIESVVETRRWAHNGNNTEIGFSYAVDFARISEVYIGGSTQKGVELGDPIYHNAAALLEALEQQGISLPEKRAKLGQIKRDEQWTVSLLKFFLEMAGFASRGTIETQKGLFDVFERTGEPDYVRGFRYIPKRKACPLKHPGEEKSSAESAAASKPHPPAEPSKASEQVPRVESAAVSKPRPPKKRASSMARPEVVKPKIKAGNKK